MNYLQTKRLKPKTPARKALRLCGRLLAVIVFVSCGLLLKTILVGFSFVQEDHQIFRSRHLLASVAWERCDFEIGHDRNYSNRDSWWAPNEAYGWLTLYIVCILIMFVALAIICDDFFVPSLEAISEKLDLSEDVAGATFMAAGSSAPELFTSVAAVTVESDVGVGTIVGSAVFNLLVIIALTAALAGKILQLDWRPLCRDSVCYAISIAVFIWFSWDGKFELYESAILLVLYILYIILMKFNYKLMDMMSSVGPKGGQISPQATEATLMVSEVESQVESKVLDGAHGTPAGKLPPIKQTSSRMDPTRPRSSSHLHPHKHFAHANKGDLSRSFTNLSMGRSQNSSQQMSRLSISFPILRDVKTDDIKVHRRSSAAGHSHEHHHIRIKSIAQGQVLREMRRRSEMLRMEEETAQTPPPPAVTVVQVQANGIALPPDDGQQSRPESSICEKTDTKTIELEDRGATIRLCPCLKPVSAETPEYPEDEKGCWIAAKYGLGWLLFIVSFPFVCLFTWTIPDCSQPHNRKYFLLSFLMSIVWIAILSFGMVTLVGRSGCILAVDKFTMGLVVVAIGTSVPDALSSILVARDGFGDMAVSNAIGSNVFDINLGLGLPFVIGILINSMKPIHLLSVEEEAALEANEMLMVPHAKFGFLLLLILVVALGVFALVRFTLKKIVGICFVCMYIAFVAYAYIQDLYCKHSC